jgi:hypothetical protein
VSFATTIVTTRAYDNVWEANDEIGVYMLSASDLSATDPTVLAPNMRYVQNLGPGEEALNLRFAGADEANTILWPDSGEAVDFMAYYPYCQTISDFVYPVDISTQQTPQEIDLMWSDNVKGVQSGNPALVFRHRLSKLVFRITDLDDIPLAGMTSTIAGLPTQADFNVVTGQLSVSGDPALPFDARLASTEAANPDEEIHESAVVEAIVLPGEDLSYTVTFTLESGAKAVFEVQNVDYEPGKRYTYTILLKSPAGKVDFGELNSIDDWQEAGDPDTTHELPKDNGADPSTGEQGATTPSGTIEDSPTAGYTILGDGIPSTDITKPGFQVSGSGTITIQKSDYAGGVASVTVNVSSTMSGRILSVKVDGTAFVYGAGYETSTGFSGSTPADYIFESPDGELRSGTIEIVVTALSGKSYFHSFTIN